MSIITLAPSQVLPTLLDSSFVAGTVIKVVGTPTDRLIDLTAGGTVLDRVFDKPFSLISEHEQTYDPDPFGFAVIGKAPRIWRPKATSYLTIRGSLRQNGTGSKVGLWDFRNFNWEFPFFPDWIGNGETWASIGARYTTALISLRPGDLTGSNMALYLEDIHFRGPRVFDPSGDNALCDSPVNQYAYSGSDYRYFGMIRADGTSDANFLSKLATGRGPWPGKGGALRNIRNVVIGGSGVDVCYNPMNALPQAVNVVQMDNVSINYCSVENLGGGFYVTGKENVPFTGVQKHCWEENLWGDWDHGWTTSYGQTEANQEFQLARSVGNIQTGGGCLSGLDLGNPHVDHFQGYIGGGTNSCMRLMFAANANFIGGIIGQPQRGAAQQMFGGGVSYGQVKVFKSLAINTREKGFNLPSRSYHLEGVQTLAIMKAPDLLDVTSGNVTPNASGNGMYFNSETGKVTSKGLVRNCNAKDFQPAGVGLPVYPRYIGCRPTGAIRSALPTTIAPNANVDQRSVAEAYTNCRQPDWPEDIDQYLLSWSDFSNLLIVAQPAASENVAKGTTGVLSAPERLSIGDFDTTASIEIVTPGLEWRMMDYVGATATTAFSTSPGTVKDGQHLQLRANAAASAATPKDYYYKVGGQLQKFTIITAGEAKYPAAKKTTVGTGQWAKTAAGALITSPTSDQQKKGMIYLRWSVDDPLSYTTSAQFFSGASGRTMRTEITTTAGGYSINFGFGTSGGSSVGGQSTGNLTYGKVYEAFFVVDLTIATANSGIVVREVGTANIPKPWTTTNATVANLIAWEYNHTAGTTDGSGLRLGQPVAMTLYCAGVWAGEALSQDAGLDDGSRVLYDPGSFPPERMGWRGTGLSGNRPAIFILGKTAVANTGALGGAWGLTAAAGSLTDVGGVTWENAPGVGPQLALTVDDMPTAINEGDTFDVTVRALGSNEALSITPSLSAGLSLVGGPSFPMGENAKVATFQVKATGRGARSISVANNVGYVNPDQATAAVGKMVSITVLPADGFAGDPHQAGARFAPA